MRTHLVTKLLLLWIICHLTPSVVLANGPSPQDVANLELQTESEYAWVMDSIDAGGNAGDDNVGAHVSLARHPHDGTLYISYYDATNGNLKLARHYSTQGEPCGPGGTWACQTVDNIGDVGQYSSLAMNPVSGDPAIAYYDATQRALKYAEATCDAGACTWHVIQVEEGLTLTWSGKHPSLKIGSDGIPRIAYHRSGLNYGALKFATQVGTGGNCGPDGSWQCDTIDSSLLTGLYPSLDLTSATTPYNVPYIAYYDKNNGDLRWTWYLGNGGGDCGPDNDWACMTLDIGAFDADVGRFPALRLVKGNSSNDHTGIAYYDVTNDRIKYAYPQSGGICGGGNWQCDAITSSPLTTGEDTPIAIELVADADYHPIIIYGCPSCYGPSLNTATYLGLGGNCGPAVQLLPTIWTDTWQCEVTISDPMTTHDFSQTAGAVINGADMMSIAFYDATDGNLMLAQQHTSVFLPLILR